MVGVNSKNLTHKNSLGSPQVFSGDAFGGYCRGLGGNTAGKNYSNRCFSLVGLGLKCGGVLINKVRLPPSRGAFFV